jgi:hypothetical protein
MIDHQSEIDPVSREALLAPDNDEDWLLYFTPR